jgi:hypothetical protein
MDLNELAQTSARLAAISDESSRQLREALAKWFATAFVRGAELSQLRSAYKSGAFTAFSALLSGARNKDYIVLLGKIDKHRPQIQLMSRQDMFVHIERLASGAAEPAPEPKTAPRTRGKQLAKARAGILEDSKY